MAPQINTFTSKEPRHNTHTIRVLGSAGGSDAFLIQRSTSECQASTIDQAASIEEALRAACYRRICTQLEAWFLRRDYAWLYNDVATIVSDIE